MSGEELRAATQELVDDIDAGRMFMNKVLRVRAALAAPSTPEPSALDAAYRERGAVVAALIRTNGWPAWVAPAPDADGWVIAYAETPEGQVSWHYGPSDFDLIDFLEPGSTPWDGHTTEEKYERLAALTGPGYGAAPSTPEPSGLALTRREEAEVRRNHTGSEHQCQTCMHPRPCLYERLLATIDALRTAPSTEPALSREVTVRAVHDWFCGESVEHGDRRRPRSGWVCERGADAVLARLAESQP